MNIEPFVFSLGPMAVILVYALFNARFLVRKEALKTLAPSTQGSLIVGQRIYHFGLCLVAPVYTLFKMWGITPNQITTLGFLFNATAAGLFVFGVPNHGVMALIVTGWLIWAGGLFDLIDGLMAKTNGQSTVAGAYYDSVMDRFSEATLFIALAWLYRADLGLVIVLLAFSGAMITSYSRSAGEKFGAQYKGGLMQRAERIIFLGAGAILAPAGAALLSTTYPQSFAYGLDLALQLYLFPLSLIAVLSCYTAVSRTWHIFKVLKEVAK